MIKTRGEYNFVSIPYSIMVNGDVMPLRKGHEQSILRGEDIAFLLEAVERKHCMMGHSTINRTLDRRIAGGNYRYVISSLKALVKNGYAVHNIVLQEHYDISDGDSALPTVRVPNYKVEEHELKGNDYFFQTGSPLKTEPILDLFDDIKTTNSLCIAAPNLQVTDYSYDTTKSSGWNDNWWGTALDGKELYRYRSHKTYNADDTVSWDTRTSIIKSGTYALPMYSRRYFVQGVAWVLMTLVYTVRTSDATSEEGAKQWLCPITYYVNFSEAQLQTALLRDRCQKLIDSAGLSFDPSSPNGGCTSANVTISISHMSGTIPSTNW